MKRIIAAIIFMVLLLAGIILCSQYTADRQNEPAKASISVEPAKDPNEQAKDLPTEEPESSGKETKTDSGRYAGQSDNNFIEIKLSGVPEENSPKVFMLSEEIKNNFGGLGLNAGDPIKFEYYINENGQNVITGIEKIKQ